jgi:hypothetical protein
MGKCNLPKMKKKVPALLLYLIIVQVSPLLAQWQINGIRIANVSSWQWAPWAIEDGEGGVIVCWEDSRNGTWDIYAQRVDSAGYLLWTDYGIPVADGPATQDNPVMVSDGEGGAIIAWEQPALSDVYAQRINGAGHRLWGEEGIVVCSAPNLQYMLDIASDGFGGAVLVWEDSRDDPIHSDIYAQRISAEGEILWDSNGVGLCAEPTNEFYPLVIGDGTGGAIAAWEDSRDGRDWAKIYAQRVDSTGRVLWRQNGVPVCTDCISDWHSQRNSFAIAIDGSEGAIIAWTDETDNLTTPDVYIQHIDFRGHTRWGDRGIPVAVTQEGNGHPWMFAHGQGGVILTWLDDRDSLFIQRVDSEGQVYWEENGRVLCDRRAMARGLVQLDDSTFSVVGTSSAFGGWAGRSWRADTSGNSIWGTEGIEFTNMGTEYMYHPVKDGTGGLIVVWQGDYYLYAQRIYNDGHVGGDTTTVVEELIAGGLPPKLLLLQNYPNPFNSTTTISFYVPVDHSDFTLKILNIAGQEVRKVNLGNLKSGYHAVTWGGKDQAGKEVSSGLYFYSITSANESYVRKLTYLK